VGYVDHWIGELLDGLDARRVPDETLVALTADHGECFENGVFFEHSDCLQPSALRVPLLVRQRGSFDPGVRSDAVVSHIDIAPTLLEAVGLPVPASFAGVPLQRAEESPGERHVIVQHPFYQQRAIEKRLKKRRVIETVAGMPTTVVVVDEEKVGLVGANWKYLRTPSSEELYRLSGDADEMNNRVNEQERVRSEMAAALDAQLELHPLVVIDTGEINDELRATLEALGYIQ
jgi:arylsulfatase A-like enzyme